MVQRPDLSDPLNFHPSCASPAYLEGATVAGSSPAAAPLPSPSPVPLLQVSRYGIPAPRAFLAQHFPEGIALDSAYVAPSVVHHVEACVEEALTAGTWWVGASA